MKDSIFILIMVIVAGIRVLLHFVDKGRIESAAKHNGWRDVSVSWCPLIPRRFFGKGRYYLVRCRDEEGMTYERYCKISLLMGITWIDEMS